MDIIEGKKYKTNEDKIVKITRISLAFAGFPYCAEDVNDGTPYRFNRHGIDYFHFSHKIVEMIEE